MKRELTEETVQNHPNKQEQTRKSSVREATQNRCVGGQKLSVLQCSSSQPCRNDNSSIPSSGPAKDVPGDVAESTFNCLSMLTTG